MISIFLINIYKYNMYKYTAVSHTKQAHQFERRLIVKLNGIINKIGVGSARPDKHSFWLPAVIEFIHKNLRYKFKLK